MARGGSPGPSTSRPQLLGLLRRAKENPEGDAPRLALAGWLEANGEKVRARYVRLQCERERMGLEWDDPRDVKARAAEKKLWDAHQREWLGPLAGYLTTPWCERGLLCGCLTVRTFAGRPFAEAARCEAWAWLERVYMAVSDATAAQLAACPLLRDLTWVRLYSQGRFGRAGAVKLTASPHLTGLHTLSLGFACDAGMVEVLLAHRGLASLWDLSFRKCKLGDDGARAVAAAAHLSGLRRLDLRYNRISSPGAAALVAASHLSGLELLDLRNNPLGEAASEQVRQRFGDRVLL